MGLGNDSAMLVQLKKAQGETNERLERLLAEQQKTNQLLASLIEAMQARP
jgi:septal ring factor EnvC (AmiA/AmiB activator)